MKIRNGFVSNSSSSSFILRKSYLAFTKYEDKKDSHIKYDKIKQDIIKMVLRHYKNADKDFITQVTAHLNEGIKVGRVLDLLEKIRNWYAPVHIKDIDDVVIYAEDDNLIPYKVFEKIKKKFDLIEYVDCYNHMG